MNTFFKWFPWFFGALFVIVVAYWIFLGFIVYKAVDSVEQQGLKAVIEQIWCGANAECLERK